MSILSEFKAFALRGNAIDLAIAVVIGAAFNKIVSALVEGIIMPFLGIILGGIDLSPKTLTIHNAVFKWGLLLQSIIDFTIMAFVIFAMVKALNTVFQQAEKKETISPEVEVLREIRDELQKKQSG